MDIRITNARISFAHGLWNKSAAVEGSTPKYSCDYIITPESKVERKTADGKWVETTIQEAEKLTAKEAFKGDAAKANSWLEDLDSRQKSVRVGNKNKDKAGEIRAGYEGNMYVAAKSATQMPVYRGDRTQVAKEEDSPIYSGCYVNARVSLYANLKPGQKGLFASLQGTQFAKDGDAFGGGRAAGADDFEPVTAGAGADDFA